MITATGPIVPDTSDDVVDLLAAHADPDTVREKLEDAQTPGYQAEFDPLEAEAVGAFFEDALTEADAIASSHDQADFVAPPSPLKP